MTEKRKPLAPADRARVEREKAYVEECARRWARSWPGVDEGELVSAAYEKLVEVAPAFDPRVQDDFRGFVYLHIHGAVVNEALKTKKLTRRQRAIIEMDQRGGMFHEDAREQMALALSPEGSSSPSAELRRYIALRAAGLLWMSVNADPAEDPSTLHVAREEYRRAIACMRRAIEGMEPRPRLILDALYKKGLTNERVGASLDPPISGKQVQRIHKEAREGIARALAREGILQAPEIIDDDDDEGDEEQED